MGIKRTLFGTRTKCIGSECPKTESAPPIIDASCHWYYAASGYAEPSR